MQNYKIRKIIRLNDIVMKKIKIYVLPILLLIVLSNLPINAQQVENDFMDMSEFIEKYKSDSSFVVLDVRTIAELSGPLGKIDGIINIPIQQLLPRMDELYKYKNKVIAVICRSGNRSFYATRFLIDKGFKAKNVLGGMIEFRKLENNK